MDTRIVHKVKDDHAKIRDEDKTSTYAPIIGRQVGGGHPTGLSELHTYLSSDEEG
jgi:hypothetical protein